MFIEELNMSQRTTEALKQNGINTLDDIKKLSEEDIIKLRNFGRMSTAELMQKLRELKIELPLFREN